MGEKPTIADVARAAGVSKGLVSFALNARPGVSAATKQRILAAADELGFRPSVQGRSLSTRLAYSVGLVISVREIVNGIFTSIGITIIAIVVKE